MRSRVLTYNGYRINDDFRIGNIHRPLPEFVNASTKVDGSDGEWFDSLTIGTREFSFDIMAASDAMDPSDVQQKARKLASKLMVREPKSFTFSDEKDGSTQLSRRCVPNGVIDVEEFMRAGKWTMRFIMHDPFLYGKWREADIPGRNYSTQIDFGGNVEVHPYFTVHPYSGQSYTLKGKVDGSWVDLKFIADFSKPAMQVGDEPARTLAIDFYKQTAYAKQEVQTTFQDTVKGLAAGSRFFRCKGKEWLKATHATHVKWQERWL